MSQLLDREVVGHRALVVDANALSRSVLVQQLRGFGFEAVKQASRVLDARDMLEHGRFHLVVCDHQIGGSGASGQDLLDELRREQLLPHATVFVMVTAEATYAKVADAAEAALDSYLVRPFSANTLFERVKEARQRKRVLKDIFDAIEQKDFERGAQLCQARFEERRKYWLYAARIGAELMLGLKQHDKARALYRAAGMAKATPWASLGLARVQMADGDLPQARRTLDSLLAEMPHYADAYDVLGRLQVEQGQLADALATYRAVAELTPGCILRLQHCGTLAFYGGEFKQATEMLERTWALGRKSRLFDVLSMMLLAFMRSDARDGKGLMQALETIEAFSERYAQSRRLRHMAHLGAILVELHQGRVAPATELARQALELEQPHFDMEAATNVLCLWSRLADHGISGTEFRDVVCAVARRFCVSRVATEVLVAAVHKHADAVRWIRQTHADVMQTAEQAMQHTLAGRPKVAVLSLLSQGGESGNAKLIEMASAVAQRHRERIDDVDTLLATAGTLAHRFCAPSTHIAGVRRSNRSAGGLVLRR